MFNGKKKWLAIGLLALVASLWIGAAAALVLLKPTLAWWTVIVTVAAVATEAALWVGAVPLGIEAITRLRAKLRLRRAP